MKSLVAILHHNTISYTDNLYEMLFPYQNSGNYDLIVIDNGSDAGKSSKYTTYKSEENTGFGGGLDMTLQLLIDSPEYDSLGFFNSDIILHGYNFVKTIRKLFEIKELMVVSPCVIQPEKTQSFWKQMHCWNSKELRIVPFVDYNCPFMKREFVEKVKSFGSKYGWVQDMMTGIICEDNNWKIGVCDWLPVVHIGNGTVKDNPHLSNYNILAQQEMDEYFTKNNLMDRVNQLKLKSINYNP